MASKTKKKDPVIIDLEKEISSLRSSAKQLQQEVIDKKSLLESIKKDCVEHQKILELLAQNQDFILPKDMIENVIDVTYRLRQRWREQSKTMTTPTDSRPWTIPPFAARNGSAARVDCNLCDECMDAFKVNKTLAWMGHTDEGGGVMCDKCGRMQARLCFRVKPQNM